MDIQTRNRDIVSRHTSGETLASIGKSYGISRERARQIFALTATDDEKSQASAAAVIVKPTTSVIDDPDFPKDENRIRIHVPNAGNTDISQRDVRSGIRRWLAGEFDIPTNARGSRRFGPVISASMHVRLSVKCTSENIPIATAVRGIIAYLENENESH